MHSGSKPLASFIRTGCLQPRKVGKAKRMREEIETTSWGLSDTGVIALAFVHDPKTNLRRTTKSDLEEEFPERFLPGVLCRSVSLLRQAPPTTVFPEASSPRRVGVAIAPTRRGNRSLTFARTASPAPESFAKRLTVRWRQNHRGIASQSRCVAVARKTTSRRAMEIPRCKSSVDNPGRNGSPPGRAPRGSRSEGLLQRRCSICMWVFKLRMSNSTCQRIRKGVRYRFLRYRTPFLRPPFLRPFLRPDANRKP